MREIVEEVLRIEEKAAKILKDAKDDASALRAESEAKASDILAKAKKESQQCLHEALESAKDQSEALRKEIIAKADQGQTAEGMTGSPAFEKAVLAVTEILSIPEYRQGK